MMMMMLMLGLGFFALQEFSLYSSLSAEFVDCNCSMVQFAAALFPLIQVQSWFTSFTHACHCHQTVFSVDNFFWNIWRSQGNKGGCGKSGRKQKVVEKICAIILSGKVGIILAIVRAIIFFTCVCQRYSLHAWLLKEEALSVLILKTA